jgi:type IV secretion system protein VirB4
VIDKDHGLEILTRALGGEYRALNPGVSTGFNPLRLEITPANTEFLKRWLHVLARGPETTLAPHEQADLDRALAGCLALKPSARRLSRLVEFLDATERDGVYARLSRWCESTGGANAKVFDNATDAVAARLNRTRLFGFDVTGFLNDPFIRVPVTMYLLHLIGQLVDGRRLVCWCDEFSKLLDDPAFEAFSRNALQTWRKLNAVFVAATQSASHALGSAISRTIVEQTASKIIFPHSDALQAEYVEGLALSQREFDCIRAIPPGARRFLVKQGTHSIVCELPLQGFDSQLAVISGRATSVQLMHRLVAEHGGEPQQWLPHFQAHFEVSYAS